jgi:hypothetical protein
LNWDAGVLVDFMGADLDLLELWNPDEMSKLLEGAADSLLPTDPANDPNAEWAGMPEFENEPKAQRTLYIHFRDNEAVKGFADLMGQAITDKTKSLWYPYKPDNLHMDKNLAYANES